MKKEPVLCPLCGLEFKMRCHLVVHMRHHHDPSSVSLLHLRFSRSDRPKKKSAAAGTAARRLVRAVGGRGSSSYSSAVTKGQQSVSKNRPQNKATPKQQKVSTPKSQKGTTPKGQKGATSKEQIGLTKKQRQLIASSSIGNSSVCMPLRCQRCGRLFLSRQGLQSHEMAHRRAEFYGLILSRQRKGEAANSLPMPRIEIKGKKGKKKKKAAEKQPRTSGGPDPALEMPGGSRTYTCHICHEEFSSAELTSHLLTLHFF